MVGICLSRDGGDDVGHDARRLLSNAVTYGARLGSQDDRLAATELWTKQVLKPRSDEAGSRSNFEKMEAKWARSWQQVPALLEPGLVDLIRVWVHPLVLPPAAACPNPASRPRRWKRVDTTTHRLRAHSQQLPPRR